MSDSYKRFWNNILNFSGTSPRADYWWPVIINYILVGFVAWLINSYLGHPISEIYTFNDLVTYSIVCLVALIVWIGTLSVKIRRLHDTDHAGWWVLIDLIPVIGTIWFFVLMVMPTSKKLDQCEFFRVFNSEGVSDLCFNQSIAKLARYFFSYNNLQFRKEVREKTENILLNSDINLLKDAHVACQNYLESKRNISNFISLLSFVISIIAILSTLKLFPSGFLEMLLVLTLSVALFVILEKGVCNHSDFARWADDCIQDVIKKQELVQ